MSKFVRYIIVMIAVAAIAAAFYFYFHEPDPEITVDKGRINNVETMVRLCTVDIYSEVPVLDTINSKVIFAVQKQKGSVSFDLEHLQADTSGDTVRVVLPREIVELYESTDDNSWEVIDTKNIGRFSRFVPGSDKLTDREENAVKARIKRNSRRELYRNGTIERARAEAARNLELLMGNLYRKPVQVIDSTPRGVL